MNLRPASAADAVVIAALEVRLFGTDAWSAASVAEELSAGNRETVTAVDGDQLVGYAVSLFSGDLVELLRIGVHPEHRRRGVARSLLAAAAGRARAAGGHRMLLEVSSANHGALAFYAQQGFVEIDRRPRYYRDGSDAVVMRLSLGAGACEEG